MGRGGTRAVPSWGLTMTPSLALTSFFLSFFFPRVDALYIIYSWVRFPSMLLYYRCHRQIQFNTMFIYSTFPSLCCVHFIHSADALAFIFISF